MIPGSNLLGLALGTIGKTPASWLRFLARAEDEMGNYVSSYADPVTIHGSLQPVSSSRLIHLGLDINRAYFSFFSSSAVTGVQRDSSGDILEIAGRRYQVLDAGDSDWRSVDGWSEVIIVDIGAAQ